MHHRLMTIIINFTAAYLEVQLFWLLMLTVNIINPAVRYVIVFDKLLQLLINKLPSG
jgi:hypothetical protein